LGNREPYNENRIPHDPIPAAPRFFWPKGDDLEVYPKLRNEIVGSDGIQARKFHVAAG
jgi:hypothetical protein